MVRRCVRENVAQYIGGRGAEEERINVRRSRREFSNGFVRQLQSISSPTNVRNVRRRRVPCVLLNSGRGDKNCARLVRTRLSMTLARRWTTAAAFAKLDDFFRVPIVRGSRGACAPPTAADVIKARAHARAHIRTDAVSFRSFYSLSPCPVYNFAVENLYRHEIIIFPPSHPYPGHVYTQHKTAAYSKKTRIFFFTNIARTGDHIFIRVSFTPIHAGAWYM